MSASPAGSSSSSNKPLSWRDASGNLYHYYQNPIMKSVVFILIQEMCERLAFYGIVPNLQTFLKQYLNYEDAQANSYIANFNALIYFTPLLSATLSDTILGLYLTIVIFSCVYMAGLALLTVSSIEGLTQPWMVHTALMVLIAFGSGGIKSCVNVMGAQQFHPEEHKSLVTRYYTYFYASIQIGALVSGLITPILVEEVSFFASFVFPLASFVVATFVFMLGNFMGRYVKPKPQGSVILEIIKVMFAALSKCSLEKCKESKGGKFKDDFIEDAKMLFRLVPLFSMVIPFMITYSNTTTTFMTQAWKLDRNTFGYALPPAMMQNIDPVAVIFTSIFVDMVLFPILRKRNMMPSVLVRFCIGSLCGVAAALCCLALEYAIMGSPLFTVSIWWQVPQFSLLSAGQVFLISTSYEVAFTHSPNSLKAVASAFNLLFFSMANLISGAIFKAVAHWMPSFDVENPTEESHTGAHYDYFYMLLAGICSVGAVLCLCLVPYFNKVKAQNEARELSKKEAIATEE